MEKNICILERQFIAYLTKWLYGERIKYIKMDVKRNSELEETYSKHEIYNLYEEFDWVDLIEDKSLYFYIKNLDERRKFIIHENIILNIPLTEVAEKLGISKQLASAYKQQFLSCAKKILSEENK